MRPWLRKARGSVLVAGAVLATAGAIIPVVARGVGDGGGAAVAQEWVNTTAGGSPQRCPAGCGYDPARAYGSFAAAAAAASAGDTIVVKSNTYPPQSCDGPAGGVTVRGEDGTKIMGPTSGSFKGTQGLSFGSNCTVDNVDVGGGKPFVFMGFANNRWENSALLEATMTRKCADNDTEPILIQSADPDPTITNVTIGPNVDIQAQYGANPTNSGCLNGTSPDNFHLEAVRIDQKVDGVCLCGVTFRRWPGPNQPANSVGYGSGQVFVDTLVPSHQPQNITVSNSRFEGGFGGSAHMQSGNNVDGINWTIAYTTFQTSEPLAMSGPTTGRSVTYIGNVGPRPQNCLTGFHYNDDVWQWISGTPCGTDKLVIGPSGYSTSNLGLNSDLTLAAGSPAIDAGEAPSASDYCTGALGSVDRDGDPRPVGAACDAGSDERAAG